MLIVLKSVSLNLLEPSGPVQDCNGIALPFYLFLTDSDVAVDSIVTLSYGLKERGIGVALPAWTELFIFSKAFRQASESLHLPDRLLSGALLLAVRRSGI